MDKHNFYEHSHNTIDEQYNPWGLFIEHFFPRPWKFYIEISQVL